MSSIYSSNFLRTLDEIFADERMRLTTSAEGPALSSRLSTNQAVARDSPSTAACLLVVSKPAEINARRTSASFLASRRFASSLRTLGCPMAFPVPFWRPKPQIPWGQPSCAAPGSAIAIPGGNEQGPATLANRRSQNTLVTLSCVCGAGLAGRFAGPALEGVRKSTDVSIAKQPCNLRNGQVTVS